MTKETEIKKELEEIKSKAVTAKAVTAVKCAEYIIAIDDKHFWEEYSKISNVHALTLMKLLVTKTTGLRIGNKIVTMDKYGDITETDSNDCANF